MTDTRTVNTDLIVPFIDATKRTFEMMAQTQVSQRDVYVKKNDAMFGSVTGLAQFRGAINGTVAVSLSPECALSCVRRMIGEDEEDDLAERVVHDAVREIIGILVADAKTRLTDTEYAIELDNPTVVSGRGHKVYHGREAQITSVIFATEDDHDFALDISVQP